VLQGLVQRMGFEPMITILKEWRPKPLD